MVLYTRDEGVLVKGLYTAFLRSVENGFVFTGEAHDFWEIMYCIKGSAVVSTGDKVLTLQKNQIIFFHPMEFHSFRVEKENPSEFFIASFEVDGNLIRGFKNKMFNLTDKQIYMIKEIIGMFSFNDRSEEQEKLIENLKRFREIPYSMTIVINRIENFFVSLSKGNEALYQPIKNNETEIYLNALRIIDEMTGEKLTVLNLAEKCNVSTAHLKNLFKKYSGMGVHRYILKNKILLAKQMLIENYTVTEISDRLGFASQSYFSTAFKRETGQAPTEYIKQ